MGKKLRIKAGVTQILNVVNPEILAKCVARGMPLDQAQQILAAKQFIETTGLPPLSMPGPDDPEVEADESRLVEAAGRTLPLLT